MKLNFDVIAQITHNKIFKQTNKNYFLAQYQTENKGKD